MTQENNKMNEQMEKQKKNEMNYAEDEDKSEPSNKNNVAVGDSALESIQAKNSDSNGHNMDDDQNREIRKMDERMDKQKKIDRNDKMNDKNLKSDMNDKDMTSEMGDKNRMKIDDDSLRSGDSLISIREETSGLIGETDLNGENKYSENRINRKMNARNRKEIEH